MNFKLAVIVFLAGVVFNNAAAQNAPECESSLKNFDEQVNAANYIDAASALTGLLKTCPKYAERIYTGGEAVLLYNIESAQDTVLRQKFIDELVLLYRQYDKNFPQNTNANEIKQVMLLDRYNLIDKAELFKRLDAAFKKNSRAFTDYNALEAYFLLYHKQYEAGDKGITQEQFIEKYGEISAQAVYAKSTFENQRDELLLKQETMQLTNDEKHRLETYKPLIEGFEAVIDNVNILALKHFTCDKLELYYEKNYEANTADAVWLQGLVDVMFKNRCTNSAVLQKAALALHQLKPSAQSSFYLGSLAQRKSKIPDAIAYYEQSAKLESTPAKKAERYYSIAGLLRSTDKTRAKEYALMAAQANPKYGKPYIFLAELYASSAKDCGFTPFEGKALNWLAVNTLKKAEMAEPKYKATVAAMAQKFNKNAPTKDEVKAAGKKKGKSVSFGCWINETITIPNI